MFFDRGRSDGKMTIAGRITDDPAGLLDVPSHPGIIRHEIQHGVRNVLGERGALHALTEIAIAHPHLLTPEPVFDLRTRIIARDMLTAANSQSDEGNPGLLHQLPPCPLAQEFAAAVGVDWPRFEFRGQPLGAEGIPCHYPVEAP